MFSPRSAEAAAERNAEREAKRKREQFRRAELYALSKDAHAARDALRALCSALHARGAHDVLDDARGARGELGGEEAVDEQIVPGERVRVREDGADSDGGDGDDAAPAGSTSRRG